MMPKRSSPAPARDSISCGICAFVHSGDGYGIALCRDRPLEGSSAGMELDGRHAGAEFTRYGALQFGRIDYDPMRHIGETQALGNRHGDKK
jgi:hypothetical protein